MRARLSSLISTMRAMKWHDLIECSPLYGTTPGDDHDHGHSLYFIYFYDVGSVINLQHGWHENRKFREKQLILLHIMRTDTRPNQAHKRNNITLRNVMFSAALSWSFPLFWSEWQQRRSKPRAVEPVWKPVGCKLSPEVW